MRQRQSQVSRQARLSLEDWYDIGSTGTLPMDCVEVGGGGNPATEEAASQMGGDGDKVSRDHCLIPIFVSLGMISNRTGRGRLQRLA